MFLALPNMNTRGTKTWHRFTYKPRPKREEHHLMRNFYYNIDPRDFQKFQNVAETVAERLGDFFTEVTKPSATGSANTDAKSDVYTQQAAKSGIKLRTDLAEDETNVYVYAELPGIAREDVSVTITEDRALTIKGTKRRLYDDAQNVVRVERSFGEFSRTIMIEQEILTDNISATFRDGVLSIVLPKPEVVRPKTVNIDIQ
jgi:HSP20 family protein